MWLKVICAVIGAEHICMSHTWHTLSGDVTKQVIFHVLPLISQCWVQRHIFSFIFSCPFVASITSRDGWGGNRMGMVVLEQRQRLSSQASRLYFRLIISAHSSFARHRVQSQPLYPAFFLMCVLMCECEDKGLRLMLGIILDFSSTLFNGTRSNSELNDMASLPCQLAVGPCLYPRRLMWWLILFVQLIASETK